MKSFKDYFKPVDDTVKYDLDELAMGVEVEKEHTTSEKLAEVIAKQHLAEDPQYYSKLKKIDPHH